MKNLSKLILILALTLGGLLVSAAQPLTPEQVRDRMKANLPAIDKLKKEGRIGENNKGYLDGRVELTEKEKELLKIENADRKAVYTLLAERTKTTLEQVQAVRARQIRDRSAVGVWLQDVEGRWFRKTDPPKPDPEEN